MATPNYDINYDDERFTQVESDKQAALSEVEKTYGGMISEADKYYQAQIDASKEWADKQSQLQQQQTDFAIEKIEQQKAQAKKDYIKEQSGAYVDWQKQSNQYGVNAEKMASGGMLGTGYSESSQVSMYNTYQNRVATAKASHDIIVMNYDNNIKEAMLQNNVAMAEIAYKSQQEQMTLAIEAFQYTNTLIEQQANKKMEVETNYYNRYQDVLAQINHENALKEQIRQFNEEQARLKANDERDYALKQQQLDIEKAQQDALRIKDDDGSKEDMNTSKLAYGKYQDATFDELVDAAARGEVSYNVVDGKLELKYAGTSNTSFSTPKNIGYSNYMVTK